MPIRLENMKYPHEQQASMKILTIVSLIDGAMPTAANGASAHAYAAHEDGARNKIFAAIILFVCTRDINKLFRHHADGTRIQR